MPGKPGWCAVNRGGVPKNYNTVAIRLIDKRMKSKRMVIHDTAFVAWCYGRKAKGMLDQRRSIILYGRIPCRRC